LYDAACTSSNEFYIHIYSREILISNEKERKKGEKNFYFDILVPLIVKIISHQNL